MEVGVELRGVKGRIGLSDQSILYEIPKKINKSVLIINYINYYIN